MNGLVVTERTLDQVRGDCDLGSRISIVSPQTLDEWKTQDHVKRFGVHEIQAVRDYYSRLKGDERLIIDPGCLFPSWMKRNDVLEATRHCGIELTSTNPDKNVAHFAAIIEFMQSMEKVYGIDNVRMVFWFDSVAVDY